MLSFRIHVNIRPIHILYLLYVYLYTYTYAEAADMRDEKNSAEISVKKIEFFWKKYSFSCLKKTFKLISFEKTFFFPVNFL